LSGFPPRKYQIPKYKQQNTNKFQFRVEGLKRYRFKGLPPRRDYPFRVERWSQNREPAGTQNL
jgi:hypothetical protein